jgi:hypothetical protein
VVNGLFISFGYQFYGCCEAFGHAEPTAHTQFIINDQRIINHFSCAKLASFHADASTLDGLQYFSISGINLIPSWVGYLSVWGGKN